MQPLERLNMHSMGPDFFLSGLGNFGRDFSFIPCSYQVCNMSSEHVPNSYPMNVLENAASYHLLGAQKGRNWARLQNITF